MWLVLPHSPRVGLDVSIAPVVVNKINAYKSRTPDGVEC